MRTLIQTSNLGFDEHKIETLKNFVNERLQKLLNFCNTIKTVDVRFIGSKNEIDNKDKIKPVIVEIKIFITKRNEIFVKKEKMCSAEKLFNVTYFAAKRDLVQSLKKVTHY